MSGGADFATQINNAHQKIAEFQKNNPGAITKGPEGTEKHFTAQGKALIESGKPFMKQGKQIDLNNKSVNGKQTITLGTGFGLQQKNGVYISSKSQVQDSTIINKSSGDGNYTYGKGATTGGIHIE